MANKDITETGVRSVLETMGIPSSFQGFKENAIGRAEAAATIVSSMAGTVAGMGGNVFELMRSGDQRAALDTYRQIQEAMTYTPRTQGGLERVQQIGELFEPIGQLYEQYGEAVGESTGSPLAGEYFEEFVDPLFLLGGIGGIPKRAGRIADAAEDMPRFAENVASQTTQRSNTVGTAVKASNYLDEIGAEGKTLDYGAGLGENAKAIKADETFEPFPQGEFNPTYTDPAQVPANSYGRIVSTNVLNVLPPDIRAEAVQTIGKALEPGGTALIQTWDVGAAKAGMKSKKATIVPDEENAFTTSTGSYQKGFSKQELQEYIANTLGPGYLIEPVPNKAGISGTAVTVKKIADPTIQVDLGIPEARLNEIAEQAIRAYHGSPADFDKFDLDFIGTGEGAQAYGYGLYFAEAEDVAETYKKAPEVLEGFDNFAISEAADSYLYDLGESLRKSDPLLSNAISELRVGDFPPDVIKRKMKDLDDDFTAEEIEAVIGRFDNVLKDINEKFSGRMYEVNIKANKDELLDFDKPFSEQPKNVQKAIQETLEIPYEDSAMYRQLKSKGFSKDDLVRYKEAYERRIGSARESIADPNIKGSTLYDKISYVMGSNPKEASKALDRAGVKGIRYDDGLSRGKEGGTSNFVVFDPRIIDIAKKYGVAIPVAGAILMQSEGEQSTQPEA